MAFWRKKKNIVTQEQEAEDQMLLHPDGEPGIKAPIEIRETVSIDRTADLSGCEAITIDDLDILPVPLQGLERVSNDDVDDDPDVDHSAEGGWFSRLTQGLGKSTNKLTRGLGDVITKKKLDQDTIDALEEVLLSADLGPKTVANVLEEFSKDRFGKDITEVEVREALADTMAKMLEPVAKPLIVEKPENGPFVILVCGVNGAGKTTTAGKMTKQFSKEQGFKVMIAAADTFRAAAIEQLSEWAKRSHAIMFSKDVGTDAASVAFEAYEKAKAEGVDVLMIDTAGRLQNKQNLMAELEKIIRVLKKKDENLPHATLLVLDSTTGQNAYSQVEIFKEMVDVTGLIVTKLDGSAKGGVLVGLADQYGVPVHAIGVGEGVRDLRPFNARDYARSLMGLDA